jgi:hypothetical protein
MVETVPAQPQAVVEEQTETLGLVVLVELVEPEELVLLVVLEEQQEIVVPVVQLFQATPMLLYGLLLEL